VEQVVAVQPEAQMVQTPLPRVYPLSHKLQAPDLYSLQLATALQVLSEDFKTKPLLQVRHLVAVPEQVAQGAVHAVQVLATASFAKPDSQPVQVPAA